MDQLKKNIIKTILLLFILILIFVSCTSVADIKEKQDTAKFFEAIDKEIEVGRAVFAKLAGRYGILRDQKATLYLNKLGKTLGMYTERQELEYYFGILATEKVNGYALPGGYILISLGALRRMDSPGALVGVLAHELGHINKKHILKQVKIEVRYNFFEILARFLAGPRQLVTSMVGQISDKIEEKLFINGFDYEDEYEADKFSVSLMEALNINSEDYIQYLRDLGNEEGQKDLEVLDKTHPSIEDRINKLKPNITEGLPKMKASNEFEKFKEIIDKIEYIEEKEVKEKNKKEKGVR